MTMGTKTTMFRHLAVTAILLFTVCLRGQAQERMPPIPPEKWTDAQRLAAEEFKAARGTPPDAGPFGVLLRSPEVMNRARALSDYLRFKGVLSPRIRQLVSLMTARQWTAQFEWAVQYRQALSVGISSDTGKAIADGRRPDHMPEDEEIAYNFCTELQRNQSVSDVTYDRAVAKFGEQGVVEMVSTVGYFTFLGMILDTARTPAPKDAPPAAGASAPPIAVPPITAFPRQ